MTHGSVILSEVFVRPKRTKTQSKDPMPVCVTTDLARNSYREEPAHETQAANSLDFVEADYLISSIFPINAAAIPTAPSSALYSRCFQ